MILFMAETIGKNEKEKLAFLYEKYSRRMFSAAEKILGDVYGSEDAVQNAFVSVARRIKDLNADDDDLICGYLFTVVKNEAYMILRKRKKDVSLEDVEEYVSDGGEWTGEVEGREAFEYAVNVIFQLDETYRAPLYLNAVMGYSPKEAARMLKRGEATVRVQLSRGKQIVAKKLKEAGYGT